MDSIEDHKGSLKPALREIEGVLRSLDPNGTFKPAALQEAFLQLNGRKERFSKAAKKSCADWAKSAREELREQLHPGRDIRNPHNPNIRPQGCHVLRCELLSRVKLRYWP